MKSNIINTSDFSGWFRSIACLIFLTLVSHCAEAYTAMSLGEVAGSITESFTNLAKLITSGAYLAGLGFSIGAIMKFKQHKDNPTQIPIGTPIALFFLSAALLFLPSILDVTSATMFGDSGGQTAGPHGIVFANRQ